MLFSSRSSFAPVGVLFTCTVLLGAGCASSSRLNGERLIVDSEEANRTALLSGDGIEVPSDFPQDLPLYPGAKTTMTYMDDARANGSLVQETPAPLNEVRAQVTQLFQDKGFTKEYEQPAEDVVILSFAKGSVRYQINIVRQNNLTTIQSIRIAE